MKKSKNVLILIVALFATSMVMAEDQSPVIKKGFGGLI